MNECAVKTTSHNNSAKEGIIIPAIQAKSLRLKDNTIVTVITIIIADIFKFLWEHNVHFERYTYLNCAAP